MWLGPNAVLAFAREGYKLTDVNFKDLIDALGYRYVVFKNYSLRVVFSWCKSSTQNYGWHLPVGFGFFDSYRFTIGETSFLPLLFIFHADWVTSSLRENVLFVF